mmetsp:Transcript_24727/g.72431  ORF Transcript_24727/g.72431 Transcript_24727/m.72431 type:complete len:270 (-) Transcript_24727:277-1086(-)
MSLAYMRELCRLACVACATPCTASHHASHPPCRHASITARRSTRSSVAPAWPAPSTRCTVHSHAASRAMRSASSCAGTRKSAVPATMSMRVAGSSSRRREALPASIDGSAHCAMRWRTVSGGDANACGIAPTTRHAYSRRGAEARSGARSPVSMRRAVVPIIARSRSWYVVRAITSARTGSGSETNHARRRPSHVRSQPVAGDTSTRPARWPLAGLLVASSSATPAPIDSPSTRTSRPTPTAATLAATASTMASKELRSSAEIWSARTS